MLKRNNFMYFQEYFNLINKYDFYKLYSKNFEEALLFLDSNILLKNDFFKTKDYFIFFSKEIKKTKKKIFLIQKGLYKDKNLNEYLSLSSEFSLISYFDTSLNNNIFPSSIENDKYAQSSHFALTQFIESKEKGFETQFFLDSLEEKIVNYSLDWKSFSKARLLIEKNEPFKIKKYN